MAPGNQAVPVDVHGKGIGEGRQLKKRKDVWNMIVKEQTEYSRKLFVPSFVRSFFVSCTYNYGAYAAHTLIKFVCNWRKISRKDGNVRLKSIHDLISVLEDIAAREFSRVLRT